jgi:hypothetical protein
MADEFQTPTPDEEPAPVEPAEEESSDETTDFTSGEGLVALGGIVILAVWIIFDVILDEFSLGTLAIVLAILAAVLPRMKREDVEKVQRLPILMKVIGYGLAVVGIIQVVSDIEATRFDSLFAVVGLLATYAAYAMAFMGARSIKT